ncbi:laccase domain-containing protein 1 [Thalassophryne amazonica]|uniref:laccase domain-containing protein 1 n=1 Tax=Thalassophryne amazonica TaxID=390379 RepID=UPI0014710DD9|nr:laccase domain-containing protein 1 [Thalassophryne amazonica]
MTTVLLDLVHACCPAYTGSVLPDFEPDSRVFLLCGSRDSNSHLDRTWSGTWTGTVTVLGFESVAECLYRFKQTLDELDLSCVRVLTSPAGHDVIQLYRDQLFTAVYTFHYTVTSHLTCPRGAGSSHSGACLQDVHGDVSTFLQQLPAWTGEVRVLRSTLIPDCFGHGFSTRTGGVSYIPSLSSLNLFSSSRRRDPVAVVQENRRRLAHHAGFHPRPLRMVKVNHASDVWVMSKAEPESYDSIVTNQTGVVITAPGADCMPLLFADPVSKVIGAAHAGWKGTLMGVAMATVDAMVREYGCRVSDILVAVGPSVGACCFTLEQEEALKFSCIHPDCVPDPQSAKPHVNIRLATRLLLQRGGVQPEHIHDDTVTDRCCVTPCTSCHPKDFFSHVRDGTNFGTQLGFLWIKEMNSIKDNRQTSVQAGI